MEKSCSTKNDYWYLMVTEDEYELPIAVAESAAELARMIGVKVGGIHKMINNTDRGLRINKQKHCKYIRIKK